VKPDPCKRLYVAVIAVSVLVMVALYLFTAAWNVPLGAR